MKVNINVEMIYNLAIHGLTEYEMIMQGLDDDKAASIRIRIKSIESHMREYRKEVSNETT